MSATKLKQEFIDLLERDKEFRYTVLGLLGIREIMERLEKHDRILVELSQRLLRVEEELVRLRQEMARFEQELVHLKQELVRLREDMQRGFDLMERRLSALGARWGLMAESAFREGLKAFLEKELGVTVERWTAFDESGAVYGYPSQVELDVAVRNERVVLIEISAHARAADVYAFKRKAELYEKLTGRKPARLLLVTPYADPTAVEAAKHLDIEIYSGA